jgi:ABC-type uncharacterized transport system auxiliary subunit
MARPDYILIGELRQFHENRGASPSLGEIEVRIEVREARDKAVLWSETVYVSAAMEGMGADALADAMSRALGELATRVADGIASSL